MKNDDDAKLIKFFVPGEPRPKQSFRVSGKGTGYTPALAKSWQESVGWEAKLAMRDIGRAAEPFDVASGRLALHITFILGNLRRVDLDNLVKGTMDAMKGICFVDDSEVVELFATKNYSAFQEKVGCDITILRVP